MNKALVRLRDSSEGRRRITLEVGYRENVGDAIQRAVDKQPHWLGTDTVYGTIQDIYREFDGIRELGEPREFVWERDKKQERAERYETLAEKIAKEAEKERNIKRIERQALTALFGPTHAGDGSPYDDSVECEAGKNKHQVRVAVQGSGLHSRVVAVIDSGKRPDEIGVIESYIPITQYTLLDYGIIIRNKGLERIYDRHNITLAVTTPEWAARILQSMIWEGGFKIERYKEDK